MRAINEISFESIELEGDALFAVIFTVCWMGGIFGYMAIRSHLLTRKGLDWFGEPIQ